MGSLFERDPEENKTTSENVHYQQDYYDKLLSGASDWLASGGFSGGPDYTSQMGSILGQIGQGYMDKASGAGSGDRYQALLDAQKASADISNKALQGTMANLQSQAGSVGQAGSSRQSIAQGVAAGEAASQLAGQQAAMNQQFLQNEEALKQQGLQGLGGLFGQVGQLQDIAEGNTEAGKRLRSLMAFQNLISGNMGGTQSGTSTVTGGGPSLGQSIIGGVAAGAGLFGSDKKLKKNIKKVKDKKGKKAKTKDGIDIAEWEWNDKAKRDYGLSGKARGVIAQEVEKKRPDAVVKNKSGDRLVNYGALM